MLSALQLLLPKALQTLFRTARKLSKYWQEALVVVLALCLTFTSLILTDIRGKLAAEKRSHLETVIKFKDQQELANAEAQIERVRIENEARLNAKEADIKYTGLLHTYRMRLKAYQGDRSGPNYSQLQTTPSGPPASSSTNILISTSDLDICAINTARLVVIQGWATKASE
jgi:hypothetical protein